MLAFVVAVGTALFKTGNNPGPSTTTTTRPLSAAFFDVKMTGCTFGNNAAISHITITNHTNVRFNYAVRVLFLDGKKLFGAGSATTDYLPPGQKVNLSAVALRSISPTHLKCYITAINRFQ